MHDREPHLRENDDLVDAVRPGFLNCINETMPPAQAIHAWHGCNGTVFLAIMHKDWEDEIRGGQVCF